MNSNIEGFDNTLNVLSANRAFDYCLILCALGAHDSMSTLKEDRIYEPWVADLAVILIVILIVL